MDNNKTIQGFKTGIKVFGVVMFVVCVGLFAWTLFHG